MKKLFIGLFLLIMGTSLVACNKDNSFGNNESEVGSEFVNAYVTSGLGAVGMLENDTVVAEKKDNKSNEVVDNNTTNPNDDVINNFLELETLISTQLVKNEVERLVDGEYEFRQSVTLKMIDGTDRIYLFYYNEYIVEKDHDEQESVIKGIIEVDKEVYDIIGEREVEDGEIEEEFRITDNSNSYVIVELENEVDEESFSYKKYVNNRLVSEFEYEREDEGFGSETEIKQMTNGIIYEYEILERGKHSLIKCEIKENRTVKTVKFRILVDESGNRTYEYVK